MNLTILVLAYCHFLRWRGVVSVVKPNYVRQRWSPFVHVANLIKILQPRQIFSQNNFLVNQYPSTFRKHDQIDELLLDIEDMVGKVGRIVGLISLVPKISKNESQLFLVSVIHDEIEIVVADDVELIAVSE